MKNKVRFGVISTARIGLNRVIPAMQLGKCTEVVAIASGSRAKVDEAAANLGIPKIYYSYDAMLADPEIDAIYNPLPNHLHVSATIKALQAGKHVLCEKPIGLNAAEAQHLIDVAAQYPHLKVMEGFMYRFHPQWQKVKEIIAEGTLGTVKHVQSHFSYYNLDAANIRNNLETGGGGLMDIGCYCISFPRYIFGREPKRAMGLINYDEQFGVDNLVSGLLDFGDGISASFTCSTQLEPHQHLNIYGDKGRLEVELPVNAPADIPAKMCLTLGGVSKALTVGPSNQFTLQGDAFAKAVLNNTPVPTPLTDALNNMKVIDALFKSGTENCWVDL